MTGGWFKAPREPEGVSGPAAELPLLGLPLRERQERAFLEARIPLDQAVLGRQPLEGTGARLLVREDVALAAATVRDALQVVGQGSGDRSFVLGERSGAFAGELAFGRDEPLLVYLAQGQPDLERVAAAERTVLDPDERLVQVPVPGEAGADLVELPLTERILHPAGHWLQLLWANLLGMAPFLWRGLAGRNPVEAAVRLGWAALRAGSVQPVRVIGRLGRVGRDCRIHPSAVVEGCWIGDGVEIGPGAVVRGAVLADGVRVEEQALVELAVVSPGAIVQRQALVKLSVLGARSAVGGMVQLGVVDRDAQVKIGAHLMDMALDQGVRVLVGERLQPAPLGLAGVCVGAGSFVASGVRVAPGRALPPGLRVVPPPGDVLQRIPGGLSGTVTVRGGSLVPVDESRRR